ncbi:hypothetical protein [Actinoplanes sp. N902-109]|nr:hypothetical protein [Actinoplanes sp. N902-109]AGL16783.1 hypothetical protein L083_3273 [Actinoplanes sp. N902-109]
MKIIYFRHNAAADPLHGRPLAAPAAPKARFPKNIDVREWVAVNH